MLNPNFNRNFLFYNITMASNLLKIHPSDNVIVALRDLPTGYDAEWSGEHYNLAYGVSAKHKFVTEDIETGGAAH
jgi:altronate hydrolase